MTTTNDSTVSPASTPTRAPRPTLAPLPPSASFLATLQTPSRPWLTDLSEADLKSYIRSALARRDVRMANLYAAELARRNTLCQLEREHGYAALASALVAATVQRGKPVPTIGYNAHALDVLCASYPDIARVLAPHRREGLRAGSLRIVKGANGTAANGNGGQP